MQDIYTYIPETNYIPREFSVAAVLLLLFMVLISLVSVLNLLCFYVIIIIIIINNSNSKVHLPALCPQGAPCTPWYGLMIYSTTQSTKSPVR